MKQLNLDDFGLDVFSPERCRLLISWYEVSGKKRKTIERKYRKRFNLCRGSSDEDPYVWLERLADWRRMERLYHRTQKDYNASFKAYWDYLRTLWQKTRKQMDACAKNLQGILLQELPASGTKKKKSNYFLVIQPDGHDAEEISIAYRDCKDLKSHDASFYWGYLGSEEEEIASVLRRRNDSCMKRFHLAQAAFVEAVRIRLAAWWKHQPEESGDKSYSHRKVFTVIENDGRSYGWVSGIGGPGELIWSPDEPPIFFK
jgi:hypothetical protein